MAGAAPQGRRGGGFQFIGVMSFGVHAYQGLAGILLVLWLAAAGPREWVLGLGLALGGLWMVAGGGVRRLPGAVVGLAGIWLLASLLSFLPAGSGAMPGWQALLEQAGIPSSGRITPQPAVSMHVWITWFLSGVIFLRILSLPDPGKRRVSLSVGLLSAILVYLALAWIRWASKEDVPDPQHFGFFPNRNHSATLLAMGAVLATGLLLQGVRKKRGGLIAFSVVAVAGLTLALIFVSISRAGVVLLGGGMVAVWLLSGTRYLGGNAAKAFGLIALGAMVVVLVPQTTVKERLASKLADLTAESEGGEARLDHRVEIFSDSLGMIRARPWTGWGGGQFVDVFPQYRMLAADVGDGRHLHPESSWLWMASEAGIPAVVSLLALGAVVVAAGIRAARRGPDRALRCGCVVAGAVPLFHAVVDVPLHRESLLWLAALLFALGGPFAGRSAGAWSRGAWRAAGILVLAFGVAMLRGEWTGRPVSPSGQVDDRLAEALRLFERGVDQAPPDESSGGGAAEDPLEIAMAELEQALAIQPLDQRLHGLHGVLALHFDDKDREAMEDFHRQRLLAPTWVRLPLVQAEAWKNIREEETVRLWGDALQRARARHVGSSGNSEELRRLYADIVRSASGRAALEEGCLVMAGRDGELLAELCLHLPRTSLEKHEEKIRAAITGSPDAAEALGLLESKLGPRPR